MRATVQRFVNAAACAAVLFLLVAASVRTAAAQTPTAAPPPPPPRERLALMVVSVKPEMVAEFDAMMKNETNPALAKAGVKWRDVWNTATFGDRFTYYIVRPVEKFADFDGPDPVAKGLGSPEAYAAWLAKAGRMVNSVRTTIIEGYPEMSHAPDMKEAPKMAVVAFVSVTPGRNADYENHIKNEVLPVVKKSDVKGYWFHRTTLGGDANEYVIVTLHDNYAELEKGPPQRRVLGPEGAMRLAQKLPAGTIAHMERIVLRLNPELTYRPNPPVSSR